MPVTPLTITAGPPAFITISNIVPIPINPLGQRINLYFDSDQAFISRVSWYSPNRLNIQPGFVTESGANTKGHSPVIDLGALYPGAIIVYTISVDPTDTSGLTLRPYVGSMVMPGTRTPAPVAGRSVPVRFYTFGGTPPPGAGGSAPPGPGNNGPNIGNWSTYSWAQYNPRGTVYPNP